MAKYNLINTLVLSVRPTYKYTISAHEYKKQYYIRRTRHTLNDTHEAYVFKRYRFIVHLLKHERVHHKLPAL
jgi:hypothetical protein